jgi:cell division protein FtsX
MKWVWSWWAFFGGWAFLLYRKQYIPALTLFILSIVATVIPFGALIVAILAGGFSTYFIYKGYKHKKAEIETRISDTNTRIETMREVGGYNQWVVWVYVIFVMLLSLYIFSIIIALAN